MQGLKFALAKALDVDETITRALERGNNFVELELNGEGVLVLSALNEKNHQERYNGCPGVNDELPRVGESKQRPCGQPGDNQKNRESEGPGTPGPVRRPPRDFVQGDGRPEIGDVVNACYTFRWCKRRY